MKLTIEMELDNAAFEDDGRDEVARILATLTKHLPDPLNELTRYDIIIRDFNGNTVGKARIK